MINLCRGRQPKNLMPISTCQVTPLPTAVFEVKLQDTNNQTAAIGGYESREPFFSISISLNITEYQRGTN